MTKGAEDQSVTNDLEALLTALYVHLDDDVIPSLARPRKRRPAPVLNEAELVCVAIAQVLLRHDSERHWMRAAPAGIGYLFPRLPGQSEYNRHLRQAGPGLLQAAMWLAQAVPIWHERLRLMDGTPLRCGASRVTVERSSLSEVAGYGRDASHHCFYWDAKLMLITTADGAVCAFSLAHPKELDERKQALHLLHVQCTAPVPGPIVCDKGFAGVGIEAAVRPRRRRPQPLRRSVDADPRPAIRVLPQRGLR